MSKPIALITADWHLTHNAWKWRPNLYGDALFGLQQIRDVALKYGLPIIAAGDMFDVKRPPLPILIETQQLLEDTDGYYIQGNHDKTEPSWMSLVAPEHRWLDIVRESSLQNEPITLDPTKPQRPMDLTKWTQECEPYLNPAANWELYGLHYTSSREQLQTALDQLQQRMTPLGETPDDIGRILILHQSCSKIFALGEPELTDDMIPYNYFNIVICGHYHKAAITTLRTKSDPDSDSDSDPEIICLSPGGTHLLSIVEDPAKKMYVFCDDGAIYSKPLITRRVIRQDMRNATESDIRKSLATLVQMLQKKTRVKRPPEIETPIVYIIYNSSTVESVKHIVETTIKNEGLNVHLFFKDISEKDAYELEFADNTEFSATVSTGFDYARDVFRQSEQSVEIRNIVESMLETEPSQEAYEQIKNKFLGINNA
jgi:DNA repair exonuclease SbcCD nuclease subunit